MNSLKLIIASILLTAASSSVLAISSQAQTPDSDVALIKNLSQHKEVHSINSRRAGQKMWSLNDLHTTLKPNATVEISLPGLSKHCTYDIHVEYIDHDPRRPSGKNKLIEKVFEAHNFCENHTLILR